MFRDHRSLVPHEESLQQQLKLKSLGLSSLQHVMAHQESCLLWLNEGDVPTRFFHAHANGRRRKNHIHSLAYKGQVLLVEDSKAKVALNYFDNVLGTPATRANSIKVERLDLLCLTLLELSE
jgi:hypothetical protein